MCAPADTRPARTGWLSGVFRSLRSLDDVFLPRTCGVCNISLGLEPGPVCGTCGDALDRIAAVPYCVRCARSMQPLAMGDRDCGQCRPQRHWNVAGIARIGSYPPLLRGLVTGLKYAGVERNAALLGQWLGTALKAAGWFSQIDVLVPVPMHWRRRMQRRCDHARLLADAVGQIVKRPVAAACRRVRHRPSQLEMESAAQRFENVKHCFAPRRRAAAAVAGKTVCIIDNLMATGATVCEVSKALRRAGAKKIYAAVASRTVLGGAFQADDEVFGAG